MSKKRIVDISRQASKNISKLQDTVGSSKNNIGIVKVYNTLRPQLRSTDDFNTVRSLLLAGRSDVLLASQRILGGVYPILSNYAKEYENIYDTIVPLPSQNEASTQILNIYDQQSQVILTNLKSGRSSESIFGEGSIVGQFGAGFLTRFSANLIQSLFIRTITEIPLFKTRPEEFVKEAIAAIDRRTTETCRNVNGQVQPLNSKFVLQGTPKYASKMLYPGFHDFCRTVVAVFLKEDI